MTTHPRNKLTRPHTLCTVKCPCPFHTLQYHRNSYNGPHAPTYHCQVVQSVTAVKNHALPCQGLCQVLGGLCLACVRHQGQKCLVSKVNSALEHHTLLYQGLGGHWFASECWCDHVSYLRQLTILWWSQTCFACTYLCDQVPFLRCICRAAHKKRRHATWRTEAVRVCVCVCVYVCVTVCVCERV